MNRRMTTALVAATAATAAALTGCSAGTQAATADTTARSASPAAAVPVLKVTGGYVREPLMKDMAGGYVTIVNTGRADDRLTSVTSDLAAEVSMHRTTAAGQMEPVTSFTIPAGGRLVLAKGGNHLMLMNLRRMPAVGDTVTFQLHFAKSAPLTVRVPVQPTSYVPKG